MKKLHYLAYKEYLMAVYYKQANLEGELNRFVALIFMKLWMENEVT